MMRYTRKSYSPTVDSLVMQFGLRTSFLIVTACAIVTWITISVGFIPIVGALGSILIGGTAGALVGLAFGSSLRCSVIGALGALSAVEGVIIWLICVIAWDLFSRGQQFPVVIPLRIVLRDWLFVTATAIALLTAVPLAAVAAVYSRRALDLIVYPAITCTITASAASIVFIAFDAWSRRIVGFSGPLPYPVAILIPFFGGPLGGAAIGLFSGLAWLAIRTLWHGTFLRRL